MFKLDRVLLLVLLTMALPRLSLAVAEAPDYFPPPESQGGWRKLEKAEEIRRLAGVDPEKLVELKQWLLDADKRDFAADV